MNVLLWILQGILAAIFAMSALERTFRPIAGQATKYPWVRDFPPALVRFIGVLELLGAIGLIAPAATGIAPVLTPAAATGLAVLMALAAAMHLRRKEPSGLPVNTVLFVLAVLVAAGRFGPYGW
ncbi:DoxX family protein [Actinomadura sp. WMMB 499]|uniref:DoxX family protein n=1 Tax=Actinomadura sp. WMMB 499 TaxID=1219491 RepID=UPI0012442162|nr:DoxX family protein [Actinomadura sp. WMMB 499]QFG22437.1 DoxX family protein [Actinomadura sp. WMMB 499]